MSNAMTLLRSDMEHSEKSAMTPERLSKLTAEIDAFGRATISRADLAAFDAIRAALIEARAFFAADLRSTPECVCVLDRETIEPIESTIDPEEIENVEHIRGILARIDAALEALT